MSGGGSPLRSRDHGHMTDHCVCVCAAVESSLRVSRSRQVLESLPEHHLAVARFLFGFLHQVRLQSPSPHNPTFQPPDLLTPPSHLLLLQVSQESLINKMSSSNLACVFGVNVVRPRHGSTPLGALTPINIFTEILIQHFHCVFPPAAATTAATTTT